MPIVEILQCNSYQPEDLRSVASALGSPQSPLAGSLNAGETILIKPDLSPMWGHHVEAVASAGLITAVGTLASDNGCSIVLGDTRPDSAWHLWHRVRGMLFDRLEGTITGRKHSTVDPIYRAILNLKTFDQLFDRTVPQLGECPVSKEELEKDREELFYGSTGMAAAATACGARLAFFELEGFTDCTPAAPRFFNTVPLASAAASAGRTILMPKLKTWGANWFAGAVSGVFTLVPAAMRDTYQTTSGLAGMYGEMLADILGCLKNRPAVVSDAIEGLAPEGKRFRPGLVLVSDDCVAHDAVMARLLDIDPMKVAEIAAAYRAGSGEARLERIDIRGTGLEQARQIMTRARTEAAHG